MTARWTGPWGDHRRYRVELSADDVDSALTGGEGLVFAAVGDRTGEAVALKMLTALPVDDYGRVAQRGAVFAEVEHPNLMHQVDTFIGPALTTDESPDARDFGIIYTVADWVPGADLDDAVVGAEARTALGWIGQIAHAVDFLHSVRTELAPQGIVHRDIKPSNVRITPDGRAVLIDFGVARPFEATDLTSGVGTHLWRAPEVVGGVGEPGPASDAWGVGALAYWVLLREPPPLDSAASARERLVPAARLAGFPDPAGVAHHLSRLLELQPARRPERLDRWADELDAVARRSTARRLAKPVAAGTMALVATGLAAWSLAPSVASLGRRDTANERTANLLVTTSRQLTPMRPDVALAVAVEARHRHRSAATDEAVVRAYDAFANTGFVATLRGHGDSVSAVA
ncbi:MAG TPA: protein kinase, partial [Acidimicrobiales bacterium]